MLGTLTESPLWQEGIRGVSMKVYYNHQLKERARKLRNNSTKAEIRLWLYLKGKKMMGYDFHRQKPIGSYIADFYCPKVQLVIEVDGYTHTFEEVIKKDHKNRAILKIWGLRFCGSRMKK